MPSRPRTGLLLGGSLLFGLLVLGPAGAAVAAGGQVCMGAVIDDGGYNGHGTVVQAANVGPGSSDLQALQAAGDTVYQNNSGLVCAIDDGTGEVPADGVQSCLTTSGNDYFYWAYWEGDPYTNTWTYASIGPAAHTVSSGQTYVEGWSYQNPGPDNPNANKPSASPASAFAQACPGVQPVPSGGSGGGGASGGGSGNGGSGGGGSAPVTPSPSASATTSTSAPSIGAGSPRTAASEPPGPGTGATTTTPPRAGASIPPGQSPGTSTTTAVGSVTYGSGGKTTLADARPHSTSGGGDPTLPIVLVAVVILVLGALAWWRWRRRPLEE